MRFGRILLASLTALAAYSYTQTAPALRQHDSFPRLFQAVVPLFVAATESSASAPVLKTPLQSVLALEALSVTPLGGSLVLVASSTALDLSQRCHRRIQLRC
jgi:hypothetical protein